MYGDIVRVSENVVVVEGLEPFTILLQPDVASSVLYRAGRTLYIMDTGATLFFRRKLLEAARILRPFDRLVLMNSHAHPDHTPNNCIIHEIEAMEKQHFISERGLANLDYIQHFSDNYREIGKYFHLADGPRPPLNFLMKPLKLSEGLRDRALKVIMKRVISKFAPIDNSCETMVPFERKQSRRLPIKGAVWTGWDFGGEVFAMEARGHSPDEVVFYLPQERLLFLADESFDFFNCWPYSSSARVRSVIERSIAMTEAGGVEVLVNGHQHEVLRGEKIIPFLKGLVEAYDVFTTEVTRLVDDAAGGITVPEIYNRLRGKKSFPAIRHFLALEFPKMPGFLKTVILSLLLELGYEAKEVSGRMVFRKPAGKEE